MRIARALITTGVGALLMACRADGGDMPSAPSAGSSLMSVDKADFQWSEPVWLGPVVNSAARELNPELSPDGLSLYFTSDRDGEIHIYVSRRATPNCPWEVPVKLGPLINTPQPNFSPAFSPDGRILYFARGDHAGQDIYISFREDLTDDFGWGPPVKLGPEVNTSGNDHSPAFLQAGGGELYFNRGPTPGTQIWVVPMSRDGVIMGEARPVSELNSPTANNGAVTVRRDGRELILWSGGAAGERPGTIGLADLFVSTRQSVNHPWSEPVGMGRPVNSEAGDLEATLSADGRSLVISTLRPGGSGRQDLWMSVRSPDGARVELDAEGCPAP